MNTSVLARTLYLLVCVCTFVSCRNSYDPSTIPAERWFSQNKSSRKPKLAKTKSKQYSGRVHQSLLDKANRSNTKIVINIANQTGYILVNGQIAASSPVSTARAGKHTPRGTFTITERVRSGKISTIYKVEMPFWMRLDQMPFGLHAGELPGYPASAGCIRLPYDMARLLYDHAHTGTKVSIYSQWTEG